jgi:hypothetical protein
VARESRDLFGICCRHVFLDRRRNAGRTIKVVAYLMVAVASVAAHALNRKHHPRLGPLPAEEVDGRVFRKTDIVRSSLAELFLPFGALERASELTTRSSV